MASGRIKLTAPSNNIDPASRLSTLFQQQQLSIPSIPVPAVTSTAPTPPTQTGPANNWLTQALTRDVNRLVQQVGSGFMAPANALTGGYNQREVDPTTGAVSPVDPRMVTDASNMANLAMTGSIGMVPPEALGMGIKAFHGSPNDFAAFQAGTTGNYGPAAYFHSAAADAERYRPEGGKVYQADLAVDRPFDMASPVGTKESADIMRAIGNDKAAKEIEETGYQFRTGSELWYWGMGQHLSQADKAAAIRKAGFDAIIGDPGQEIAGKSTRSKEIALFDPSKANIENKYAMSGSAPQDQITDDPASRLRKLGAPQAVGPVLRELGNQKKQITA